MLATSDQKCLERGKVKVMGEDSKVVPASGAAFMLQTDLFNLWITSIFKHN